MPVVTRNQKRKSGPTLNARTRGAEREGFEPSIRVSTYAGLANRCLQPLGHLSGRVSEVIGAERLLQPFVDAGGILCARASIGKNALLEGEMISRNTRSLAKLIPALG